MLLVFPLNSGNDALLNKKNQQQRTPENSTLFAYRFKFLAGWLNNFFASRALAYGLIV